MCVCVCVAHLCSSVLAVDEGLRGRNVLFTNSVLRPLLKVSQTSTPLQLHRVTCALCGSLVGCMAPSPTVGYKAKYETQIAPRQVQPVQHRVCLGVHMCYRLCDVSCTTHTGEGSVLLYGLHVTWRRPCPIQHLLCMSVSHNHIRIGQWVEITSSHGLYVHHLGAIRDNLQ